MSLEDDTRFIEFYNLVFMELNRDAEGQLTPLAAKNIDTGMGLERMAQILQVCGGCVGDGRGVCGEGWYLGVLQELAEQWDTNFHNVYLIRMSCSSGISSKAHCCGFCWLHLRLPAPQRVPNNYETDLIFPIVSAAASLAGINYHSADEATKTALKVIGDHIRAVAYLLSDGVVPSNVGRGYVVRRLLRRVVMKGRLLGIEKLFTAECAKVAVELSGGCDPQVRAARQVLPCSVVHPTDMCDHTHLMGLPSQRHMQRVPASGFPCTHWTHSVGVHGRFKFAEVVVLVRISSTGAAGPYPASVSAQ